MQAFQTIVNALRRLLQWWVVVAPWEQAVRVRWGKRADTLGPGIHLVIPIDRVYRQSVRLRVSTIYGQTTVTVDGVPITFGGALQYRIEDIRKLYDSVHHAEETLSTLAGAAMAQFINTHAAAACTPRSVAAAALEELDFTRFGIGDVELLLLDFAPIKRTYRLISGSLERYSVSDSLNTVSHIAQ